VDHVVPVAQIAPLLVKLTQEESMAVPRKRTKKGRKQSRRLALPDGIDVNGTPVPMVCPDCSGPLFEVREGKLVKFHCIVGHSCSPVSLSDAHADALERALWVAIRTLKEKLAFQQMVVKKHANEQETNLAERLADNVESIRRDIELLEEIQAKI